MRVLYGEGPATHTGPESCIGAGNCAGETLTGERTGRPLSRERSSPAIAGTPGCRRRGSRRKATLGVLISRGTFGPRAVLNPAHARKHLAREPGDPSVVCGVISRRPHREPERGTPMMHERGKSDRPIVPGKPPNNARWPRRRWREGGWPRGIGLSKTRPGLYAGQARQVARADAKAAQLGMSPS
jgi:RNA-directed DNA polymerase